MHRIALRTPALFPRQQLKKTIRVPIYQLDAFASAPFKGNPAAVCPLDAWLPDETLISIAAENNLSETAFVVPEANGTYHLRWFTPTVEVNCCGHATLATGALILDRLTPEAPSVTFTSRSGELKVSRAAEDASLLSLDFPLWPAAEQQCAPPPSVAEAMGAAPSECYSIPEMHGGDYYLFVYDSEADVAALAPDLGRMGANVLATALSAQPETDDFVSRFFGPCCGIPEDPVTGSAHTTLAPYWAPRLGKRRMEARQLSARGGELSVELADDGERCFLYGRTAFFMEGTIHLQL
tara:strand:- start:88 stop:972 length:885 start_codon:yes stop_codon:yes gene_type:complete